MTENQKDQFQNNKSRKTDFMRLWNFSFRPIGNHPANQENKYIFYALILLIISPILYLVFKFYLT